MIVETLSAQVPPSDYRTEQTQPSVVPQGIIDQLRADIVSHFQQLRLPALNGSGNNGVMTKNGIRVSHSYQRNEIFQHEYKVLNPKLKKLLPYFANGEDVNPSIIDPELVPAISQKFTGYLFRLATLFWSVPVSPGYGRRIRFLVMDRSNGKLIGIFALGDPVFNLKCRDQLIGWNQLDRRSRLVNVMDAYVVGAVPPYNQLLGGKLVASLMCSQEVNRFFMERYKNSEGVISGEKKSPRLTLITVTSALGRSSLYNRLKLIQGDKTLINFKKIGETSGFGHFQISNELFERMRALLALESHSYANGHQFGQGPNWRLRVTRVGLKRLGLDEDLVHHGINREVYASPLAENFKEFLRGEIEQPDIKIYPAQTIADAALHRWIIPRSISHPEWKNFRRDSLMEQLPKVEEIK